MGKKFFKAKGFYVLSSKEADRPLFALTPQNKMIVFKLIRGLLIH